MTDITEHEWTYPAQCIEVVDGDTIDLELDLGFRIKKHIRVRLSGVDTAEVYGVEKGSDEYRNGKEQSRLTESYLAQASKSDIDNNYPLLFISDGEKGKFGRWIGDIKLNFDQNITELSLTETLEKEYPSVTTDN
jgi:micrococcal nuclease